MCPDAETKRRIDQLKNFGFVDEVTVDAIGINGKMSEFSAALGLLQLTGVEEAISKRKAVDERYREGLAGVRGIRCLAEGTEVVANYAYFPVMVDPEYAISRDELWTNLRAEGIYARRYFYPLISDFPMYRSMDSAAPSNLPVAKATADRVICLPMYPALSVDDQARVIGLLGGE